MATAIEFDFEKKVCRAIAAADALGSCESGRDCCIDIDQSDIPAAKAALEKLGVNPHAIEQALGPDREGRHDLYDDCLHFAVSAVRLKGDAISTDHVDVIVAPRFVVTIHRGPVDFIDQVRRVYQRDFEKFAKSLSFIIFEVFDHLLDNYRTAIRALEALVEQLQSRIFSEVDDSIFELVGRATRSILAFRAVLLSTRDVGHELATRRSIFVSETAQPFITNIVGTLERLSEDLAIQREVLAEALNLYMGIVSHRTNKVVNRLTALSMVFLPLTFLCGVYGMNFKNFPELEWQYSYPAFWVVALSIALGLIAFMRRQGWV